MNQRTVRLNVGMLVCILVAPWIAATAADQGTEDHQAPKVISVGFTSDGTFTDAGVTEPAVADVKSDANRTEAERDGKATGTKPTRAELKARRAARRARVDIRLPNQARWRQVPVSVNVKKRRRKANKPAEKTNPFLTLRLKGSFELELGKGNTLRGQGDVTIELDEAMARQLQSVFQEKWDEALPLVKDVTKTVSHLPDMLETSERLLKRLSDPKMAESLERADHLLKLLGQLPGTAANEKQKNE